MDSINKQLSLLVLIFIIKIFMGCGETSGGDESNRAEGTSLENGKRYVLSEKITLSAPSEALSKTNFQWQQIDGAGELSIENSDSNTITLSSEKEGAFKLKLTADEKSYTATIVWDTTAPKIELPKSITVDTETELNPIVQDASNLTYNWSVTKGEDKVSISDTKIEKAKASASEYGSYQIKLVVTDELDRSSEAKMEFLWSPSFKIAVVLSGVKNNISLKLDETEELLTKNQDGTYKFVGGLKVGATYNITIAEEPNLQNCSLQNASGTMTASEAQVSVNCAIKTFIKPANASDRVTDNPTGDSYPETFAARDDYKIRVFKQNDGSDWRISYQEDTGNGWTALSAASPSGQNASRAHLEINASGDVVLAYNLGNNIAVSLKKDGVWTHPASTSDTITTSICNFLCTIKTADIDKNGDIIVMFNRSLNGSNIYHSTYKRSTDTWSHFHTSLVNLGTNLGDWQADFNKNGDGVVVFRKHDGSHNQCYRFERINGTFINIPTTLADHFTLSGSHAYLGDEVIYADSGDAIIPYFQLDSSNVSRIYTSEKRNGTWADVTSLVDDNFNNLPNPSDIMLAANSKGNAVMAYLSNNSGTSELRARVRIDGTWSNESPNLLAFSEYSEEEVIGIDENNNAVIGYLLQGAVIDYHLFAAQYTYGQWYSPAGVADDLHYSTDPNYSINELKLFFDSKGNTSLYFSVDHDGTGDYEIFEAARK